MNWLQRYHLSDRFRRSIWFLPVFGMVVALVSAPLLHMIESSFEWISPFDQSTTLTLLGTLAASMFTLIVFVCSGLLIAVQLASSQLSPCMIGIVLQNPFVKVSLTLFVFSFTFTLATLIRIGDEVPSLTTHIAAYSCLVSLGFIFYLLDRMCVFLRPSGALRLIGRMGRDIVRDVYRRSLDESPHARANDADAMVGEPQATVTNLEDGVLLAYDVDGLVAHARMHDCVIYLVPQVGDFVAARQPLFQIFGKGSVPSESQLRKSVAMGHERTLQQDPAFALRIIVDIASKGLSPAINDPTSAVLAIDQIHYLLRHIGNRDLGNSRRRDETGTLRLVCRTPDWEDFVSLAVTEIRHFGAGSIQVARRLRAMLEDLIQTLPEVRAAALRLELDLLDRSIRQSFNEAEDRAMAHVGDSQGVGGKEIFDQE